jgi:TonB-linked SusC/RagA family outer membrane protein
MKQKLLSFFFVCTLLIGATYAQERRISGKVTAAEDDSPLPGVSVLVTGTTKGTTTDAEGNYSIEVPTSSNSLTFRFIGYVSQTLPIGNQATLSVVMTMDASELSEVVVTALGIERQKKELGYAAATVSNETLTKGNAVNVANGLQGKVSGLNVTTVSSGVFEDVKINLRGIRSMTGNNNPLLVIDGVPMDLNFLSSINPNDIDDVSVLKGSSSAALYGPDARNGVILVTTKKGSDKTIVSISNSTQFQNISFFPKLQKQFGQGSPYDGYIPFENWSWGPAFDGSMVEVGETLPDGSTQTIKYEGTDERKNFFNTGSTIVNDVSLSSKDFFVSLQDANVKGIIPDDKNRRTSIRLNTAKEFGKFRASVNFNYSQQNYNVFNDEGMSDYFTAQGTGGNDGLMNQIYNTPANIPLSRYKNYKTDPFAEYNGYYNRYGLNPYFIIGNWRNKGKRQDLITNFDLNYKPLDWLSFTYRAGLITQNIEERALTEGVIATDFGLARGLSTIPSSVQERAYSENRMSSELFGNVNKQLNDDFKLTAVLGTYVRQDENRDTRVAANSLVVPGLYNINIRRGILSGSSPGQRSRLFSIYGSAGLSYRGWASMEVTGRNDWTSLLAIGNNSYFYPGVSGSVVLSDAVESLKSSGVLSYLKLRGAWNKTGNADIDPYLLAVAFTEPNYTGFPFGSVPGLTTGNTYYSERLKPEFIHSTEFGFESSFLNSRINLEATYFYQKNTDQIISVNLSDATGFPRTYLNAASFINKGVEMDFSLTPLFKFRNGGVHFRANATYNDSEVTGIFGEGQLNALSIGGYVNAGNYAVVGQPAFVIRGTDYRRDPQGRIIVDAESGFPSIDPNVKDFGRTIPKWIIGLNPSVQWKGFNLSALFEHKGGHFASFFGMGGDMAWTGVSEATTYNNREPFVLPNSVIEDPANPGSYIENTNVTIEDPTSFFIGEYSDAASNFIVSASTWRLRELSLSYDFPESLLGRQHILKGLTVSAVGRNLFLWVPSENKFMDPDFNSMVDDYPNAFGNINSTSIPPVRNFGFNIIAKF